ncbi:MAG: ribbon-helix-helix protein, CopG family [Nitrospiraceae bacterium]|jgi:RHH-type rel operon transcriptional repressor/antitoxin RelB|nr:ribbon-helix-helix protein, CopG family [Nitrospiraceae bacterium]
MATSIRLDPATEKRLDRLSEKTGRTKAFYLRQIIEQGIEDLEDYYLAANTLEQVRQGKENTYSLEEVERNLGLAD